MPNVRFIPRDDEAKLTWLRNFAATARSEMDRIGMEAGRDLLEQVEIDVKVYEHVSMVRGNIENYGKALTAWRNAARSGSKLTDFPPAPVIPPAPPGAKPGIFPRAARLAQMIKYARGYTVSTGTVLGIIAPKPPPVDEVQARPALRVVAHPGTQPVLKWPKGRMGETEIQVKRGDGDFTRLVITSLNHTIDRAPLPPRGTAAVWTYKAIYVGDDMKRIGQWSAEISVPVAG